MKGKTEIITFRVDPETRDRITKLVREKKVTRSELIRRLLTQAEKQTKPS